MGRLVGLELHNFKSYKDTSRVGFGDAAFTSIIGPNGAGKSNMMDAISFVLGIQSAQLRSSQMSDLIYRGRIMNGNSIETTQQPSSAYVSAMYERDDGELISLKRTINNKGGSIYKINNKNVTALQYSMALKAENILVKARNFLVFQGDIESVAAQSPKDLVKLIETISGSIEYAEDYARLKEELEQAKEVATQVFSRKRNLNSESKQYKEQMREREIFESKLSEKYELITSLHLYRIFHNQKRHFHILGALRLSAESLASNKTTLTGEYEAMENLTSEYAAQALENKKIIAELQDARVAAERSRRDIAPATSIQKHLELSIASANSKIEALQQDIKTQQNLEQLHKNFLVDAREKLVKYDQETEELMSRIQIPPEGIREYEQLRSQFLVDSGAQFEDRLAQAQYEKDLLSNALVNLEKQKELVLSRIGELHSEMNSSLSPDLTEATNKLDVLKSEKEKKLTQLNEAQLEISNLTLQEAELTFELKSVENRIFEYSSQRDESKKEKKIRDNVDMLSGLFKEGMVKGLLCDLVECIQHKYESALHVALGRHHDAIVVESTAIAYKCIEILKERRAGTATFIPLDSIVTDHVNLNYLRSFDDDARPALDIIKFQDPTLERAVQFAVGNTLIVDNIDKARELKWNLAHKLSCKMVALDGSVIHTSGLMTSGQHDGQRRGARKRTKLDFNKAIKRKEEITNSLASLRNEKPKQALLSTLSEELNSIDDEMPLLESEIVRLKRGIDERLNEISFQESVLSELTQTIGVQKEKSAKLEAQIQDIHGDIARLQEKIYASFCSKYNLSTINDFEVLKGRAMRARAREKVELQRIIKLREGKLKFLEESMNDIRSRMEKLMSPRDQWSLDLEAAIRKVAQLESDVEKHREHINTLQKTLDMLNQELAAKCSLIKEKEERIKEIESEIQKHSDELMKAEKLLVRIDSERLHMLQNCKLEGVDLPLEDGFLDNLTFDDLTEDVSTLAYSVHVDYESLDIDLQDSFSSRTEAELRAKLENVEKDLEGLAPNAKAVERLKEVDERMKNFDREFTKARQDEKRAIAQFNEVKSKRTDLFMQAFTHISNQIDGIYKELTKSSACPLGGSAYLTLDDEDEPYIAGVRYHAMPPLKRFRDMNLLSGGEKTMAALSLLFAVHLFQPAPFFVLDEIDAALDNSNVARISNYIRKHAGPGFQFIVISLKSSLFENSDALIGIYREQRENSSKTVSLDLRSYGEQQSDVMRADDVTAAPA